jgi:hypothetical protein
MISSRGPNLEQKYALTDAEELIKEYGKKLTFKLRTETQVERDRYNSIRRSVGTDSVDVYVYPLEMQPNTKQLERAGFIEQHEALAWTPAKTWIDKKIDFEDIDIARMTVVVDGITYEVAEKGRSSQFLGQYLYYTFGLRRR